jgi:hypothetical protein
VAAAEAGAGAGALPLGGHLGCGGRS